MPLEVVETPLASRQAAGLRGRAASAYLDFLVELAHDGCRALGYRLTGESPLPSLCVRHLRGSDRVVVAFAEGRAWVLLVGPHDRGDAARDIYALLYSLAGTAPPHEPRTKPSCCDDGQPPNLNEAVIDELVARGRSIRQR